MQPHMKTEHIRHNDFTLRKVSSKIAFLHPVSYTNMQAFKIAVMWWYRHPIKYYGRINSWLFAQENLLTAAIIISITSGTLLLNYRRRDDDKVQWKCTFLWTGSQKDTIRLHYIFTTLLQNTYITNYTVEAEVLLATLFLCRLIYFCNLSWIGVRSYYPLLWTLRAEKRWEKWKG